MPRKRWRRPCASCPNWWTKPSWWTIIRATRRWRWRRLNLNVQVHQRNRGYGGNQKTCYAEALEARADVVVMTHPDYQYSPLLVTAMASMVA
jgi:hypothetical protein